MEKENKKLVAEYERAIEERKKVEVELKYANPAGAGFNPLLEKFAKLEKQEGLLKDKISAAGYARNKALTEKAYLDALELPEQNQKRTQTAVAFQDRNMETDTRVEAIHNPEVVTANKKAVVKSYISALESKPQNEKRVAKSAEYQNRTIENDIRHEAIYNGNIVSAQKAAIENSYKDALKSEEVKKARLDEAIKREKRDISRGY
jgi:type II secretory pathway component PulJ